MDLLINAMIIAAGGTFGILAAFGIGAITFIGIVSLVERIKIRS